MQERGIPTPQIAKKLLNEASRLNPGPWVEHSKFVALAAQKIARKTSSLDADFAYSLGLLHDIGRRFGISHIRHIFNGYRYLTDLNYPLSARIALTHSFPVKEPTAYFGKLDCSKDDLHFLQSYLKKIHYTPYDELMQLCDALALPIGFCILEKRMIDVFLRHGPTKFMREKWLKTFAIKAKFEKQMGVSIYDVLPGVKRITFQ